MQSQSQQSKKADHFYKNGLLFCKILVFYATFVYYLTYKK